MRFETWNKIIKDYFFTGNNDDEIFINIDKDSLIEYVIRSGVMNDSIKRVQEDQRKNGRDVLSDEVLVWQDFLRIFHTSEASKESFFNKMKKQISMNDSDGLYMLFPYFALFSMPLSSNPELHSRNFYTRLSNFLREELMIGREELVGTADFSAITRPSLRDIWLRLGSWAATRPHNYHLKHQFTNGRNNYVAPFMAECLFNATRKEKLRNIFYRAGLVPGNELTDEEIKNILECYHNEIDFDDAKWKNAKKNYLSLIIALFKKEYQVWDGNAIVVRRNGKIKNNEHTGTRQRLLLQACYYRGRYDFSLLAFLPDASFAERFEYESTEHNLSYNFGITHQKYADSHIWSNSLRNYLNERRTISFKKKEVNNVELVYKPNDCEILEYTGSGYISSKKLIKGKEYLVLLNNSCIPTYAEWLEQNSATEIEIHDLSTNFNLYRIRCVQTDLVGSDKRKMQFSNTTHAKPVYNLTLGRINQSKVLYKGFKTFFEIAGINVAEGQPKPKAVFNSEGRIEEVPLEYDNKTNLWALPKITNFFTLQKSFKIYFDNRELSSDSYRLCDFEANLDEIDELQFNEFGELDSDGNFIGLSLDASRLNDVNFDYLLSNMRREGNPSPKKSGNYNNSDYLLYYLSCINKCTKDNMDDIMQTLALNEIATFSTENRWAILELVNNYFRMGYINYAFHDG